MPIEAIPCPHPGCVDLRDVRYPDDDVLHLTAAEWAEFLAADAGLQPGPFPGQTASLLPGSLASTRTGLTLAGDDELLTRS